MLAVALAVVHLGLAGAWAGAMAYSLTVVQPRAATFFTAERAHEDFLVTLAHGNRWRVVGLIAAILASGLGLVLVGAVWVAPALLLYLGAAGIFANVSWRHWPARVFALPAELPGYRRRLRIQAVTMLVLVASADLIVLAAVARPR